MSSPPQRPEFEPDKTSAQSIVPEDPYTKSTNGVASSAPTSNGKPVEMTNMDQEHLDIPLRHSSTSSSDTLSDISRHAPNNENERLTGRLLLTTPGVRDASRSPAPLRTWRGKRDAFWRRNKGLALVLLSQLFGALMNATTRLLETDGSHGKGMHPFQILFARMSITLVLSCVYMWYAKVPHAPFGLREVRGLLVARGVGGFFGVYGLYYSLLYLPIAEATVITFLAPIVACWACSILLHEPFTRTEQIAGLVSLFGVVLIARPISLFSGSPSPSPVASSSSDGVPATNITVPTDGSNIPNNVTPAQRLSAVGVAMIGVLGAACAYTTIRTIGKRAHPLISVTYFALWCTIVSTLSLLLIPSIAFQLPTSIRQWSYLFFLGACGFAMQFLLTAGLQHEKGSRATNMLYTQMLFALGLDKVLWGTTPGAWSLAGSSLILGSVVYVAVRSEGGKGGRKVVGGEEERGLVEGVDTEDEDEDEDEEYEVDRERVGGVQEVQLRNTRV